MSRHFKKCMFYSEFVVGERQSTRKIQRAHIRDTITELLKGIVKDLEKSDSLESSGLSETGPSASRQISAPENSMTTTASNGDIKLLQNLDGVLRAEEAALSTSNLESRVEPEFEESIRKIRQLGEGGMTIAAATDFFHELRVTPKERYKLVSNIISFY
ncbi:hypothetical protein FNYG_13381 [Fusarium nygamai]|uniref:Uncharacterized protein n=1 Tax=Gibberella nygamai TaxID=42673 RepID=A0A2K0VTA0_GIBNY|nr:hypothetical protein FNYG_13381 [Fusarium nygamai]